MNLYDLAKRGAYEAYDEALHRRRLYGRMIPAMYTRSFIVTKVLRADCVRTCVIKAPTLHGEDGPNQSFTTFHTLPIPPKAQFHPYTDPKTVSNPKHSTAEMV